VIDTINFLPFCPFDEHFTLFVLGSRSVRTFDEVAECVGKSLDARPINEIISNYCQFIKPKMPAEVAVIKNAVFRFLFDRLYVRHLRVIGGDGDECAQLGQICERIRWLTPREMGIPAKRLKTGIVDVAFAASAEGSFGTRVRPVFTSPIDIIAQVFLALKSGEEFTRHNSFETQFGQFGSMFDPAKVANISDQLSFDDFFPMFCLMFSIACPSNAGPSSDSPLSSTASGCRPPSTSQAYSSRRSSSTSGRPSPLRLAERHPST
jgi:hypothetical protein